MVGKMETRNLSLLFIVTCGRTTKKQPPLYCRVQSCNESWRKRAASMRFITVFVNPDQSTVGTSTELCTYANRFLMVSSRHEREGGVNFGRMYKLLSNGRPMILTSLIVRGNLPQ